MSNMEEQRGKEPLAIRRATSEGDFVKNHLCNKKNLPSNFVFNTFSLFWLHDT